VETAPGRETGRLMEPREAAAMFGVKARTLRRWHQMGLISARMTMGGKRRYDRDVNAARNVLALGRRESLNAHGGQVRPAATLAPAGEVGSLRGAA
jgi:hypothetical protein